MIEFFSTPALLADAVLPRFLDSITNSDLVTVSEISYDLGMLGCRLVVLTVDPTFRFVSEETWRAELLEADFSVTELELEVICTWSWSLGSASDLSDFNHGKFCGGMLFLGGKFTVGVSDGRY